MKISLPDALAKITQSYYHLTFYESNRLIVSGSVPGYP